MCIAIHAISESNSNRRSYLQISLEFVVERILQRRNGVTNVEMDLLVRNDSDTPIDRLQVIIPYALTDIDKLQKLPKKEISAKEMIGKLAKQQCQRLQLKSAQLCSPKKESSNWIYTVVPDVTNRDFIPKSGEFVVTVRNEGNDQEYKGFVKSGWNVELPEAVGTDPWLWVYQTACQFAILEIVCSQNDLEKLRPTEKMWLRLSLEVPATGYNKKTIFELILGRTREFKQDFLSPKRVVSQLSNLVRDFNDRSMVMRGENQENTRLARNNAISTIPEGSISVPVKQWRTVLFGEYGLAFEQISQIAKHGANNRDAIVSHTRAITIPVGADLPMSRRFLLPDWIAYGQRDRPRNCLATELFFGSDFTSVDSPDVGVESITRAANSIYPVLSWLGLIGFFLALLRLIVDVCVGKFP